MAKMKDSGHNGKAQVEAAMKSNPGKNSGIGGVKKLGASKAPADPLSDRKSSFTRNGPKHCN